jgi:membrane fusion protein (multidrug efflux system)
MSKLGTSPTSTEEQRRAAELAAAKRAKAASELALRPVTWERLEKEYPRRVAAARADLAFAEARVLQTKTELNLVQVDVDNLVREGEAAVLSAMATLEKATEDANRYEKLFKQESVPEVKWEDAVKLLAGQFARITAT